MAQTAAKIPLTIDELEKLGFYEFDEDQWQHENQHGPEIFVVKRIHSEAGLDTFQLIGFEGDEEVPASEPFHYVQELKKVYHDKFQIALP
ncbi:MAG: hypothetical protein P4L51_07900 [Puia sp.]|nr:hypothetical protein [Puia sp.]